MKLKHADETEDEEEHLNGSWPPTNHTHMTGFYLWAGTWR